MSSSEEDSWISWFCCLKGNEFFCEVDVDYIKDSFNLTGLKELIHNYKQALNIILDIETEDAIEDSQNNFEIINETAEMLYGLLHARYITTNHGLRDMLEKHKLGDFGHCPRVFCENQLMLPIGLSDSPGEALVKVYCPKCNNVYTPKASRHQRTDGAYFGTGFPHMLLMVYPHHRPETPTRQFVPRLYGFRIHNTAYQIKDEHNSKFKRNF